MLHRNKHPVHRKFSNHDLESMRASEAAKDEIAAYRDPECDELRRHRPNCECRGDARAPIVDVLA